MTKRSWEKITPLFLILVVAAIGFGVIAFINSPSQVAQRWADALARGDEATLKKLVLPKDEKLVSTLVNLTKMAPGMSAQLVGIEDREGQKTAIVEVKFSRISFKGLSRELSGSAKLPFVLARDRFIFWRVDLEKSEPLVNKEAMRAVIEAVKKDPTLRWLLQFLSQLR